MQTIQEKIDAVVTKITDEIIGTKPALTPEEAAQIIVKVAEEFNIEPLQLAMIYVNQENNTR